MRKLKNRRIPNGTYGGVRGRRAEARLLLDGRRLSNRGCAANGFLMTLSRKRGNDAAGGSLPKRELSTGLRDGDESAAGWLPRPQSRPRSQQGGAFAAKRRKGDALRAERGWCHLVRRHQMVRRQTGSACGKKEELRVTLRVEFQRLRRRWNPKDSNPKTWK